MLIRSNLIQKLSLLIQSDDTLQKRVRSKTVKMPRQDEDSLHFCLYFIGYLVQ